MEGASGREHRRLAESLALGRVRVHERCDLLRVRLPADHELGLADEIALCGLAKRLEEVWVPGTEYPVILPRASEGLYLLQRLRDEAHRFAITHHRSRRAKNMVASTLDSVPGLGEMRRKALLTYFGSLRKLRAATLEEIAQVPGFGPRLAEAVFVAVADTGGEAINLMTGEVTET